YLMARILFQEGNPEEAANHLRAALRANPSHVGAHALLGRYLDEKGQPAQAQAEYEAALRVNPNLAEVKVQLGFLYVKNGRVSEALRLAGELEQSEPKSTAPPLLKGIAFLAQDNAQAAVEAFNSALKLKPDLIDARRGLAQAYQQLGQVDRAEDSYRK